MSSGLLPPSSLGRSQAREDQERASFSGESSSQSEWTFVMNLDSHLVDNEY